MLVPDSNSECGNSEVVVMELQAALAQVAGGRTKRFLSVVVWYDDKEVGHLKFDWRWIELGLEAIKWVGGHFGLVSSIGLGYIVEVGSNRWTAIRVSDADRTYSVEVKPWREVLPCWSQVCESSGYGEDEQRQRHATLSSAEISAERDSVERHQLRADAKCAGILANLKHGQNIMGASSRTQEPVATIALYKRDGVYAKRSPQTLTDSRKTLDIMKLGHPTQGDGEGAVVAVLDTGWSSRGNIHVRSTVDRYDTTGGDQDGTDGNGHGTFCISEVIGNGTGGGPLGGAFKAKVVSIKVLTDAGWGTDGMIARGIELARRLQSKVISLSIGGPDPMPQTAKQIDICFDEGIVVCVAAGNEGQRENVSYPARYTTTVSVGAIDHNLQVAPFSNQGQSLDLVGVGVAVLGIDHLGNPGVWSGTSMACPLVAAAFAKCLSQTQRRPIQGDGELPEMFITDAIYDTCLDLYAPGKDSPTGFGVVQCSSAVTLLDERWADQQPTTPPVTPPTTPPVAPPTTPPVTPPVLPPASRQLVYLDLQSLFLDIAVLMGRLATLEESSNG